ncbi:MAG: TRAP transporter small permease [Gemmatimonadota bacterium]|nr:TRAP transporter small permease [Gemmatimonadota bacterium]
MILDRIDRWSDAASRALFRLASYVGLPSLVVLVTLDVVLRYAFDAPLRWGRNVNGLLLLISMFSALPHAWDRGYHIRMEILYNRTRGAFRGWADVVSALTGIVVLGMLAVQSWLFVPYMARTGETGEELLVPIWPAMGFMGLCALVFVGRMLSNPTGRLEEAHEGDELWR